MAGYPLVHAMMMMIPEAWEQHTLMDDNRRAFYEYHAAMIGPWDGPAAIAFTDGRQIGATLDRNGLRPARYCITDDDIVIMASEAGVLPIPESKILKKWRLLAGQDVPDRHGTRPHHRRTRNSRTTCRTRSPTRSWIDAVRIKLDEIDTFSGDTQVRDAASLLDLPARPSATRRKTCGSCLRRWRRTPRKRSARWATTRRSR